MRPRVHIWISPMPAPCPKKACGGKSAICLWKTRSARGSSAPRYNGTGNPEDGANCSCRPESYLERIGTMKKSLVIAWIVVAAGMSVAAYAQNTALRAGAAKVDVTPAANALPQNYEGILDHIYSR